MSSGSLAEHHDSTTEAEQAEPRLWNRSLVWLPLFTGLVGLALLFVASELTDRKSLPGGLWWIGGALSLVAVAASRGSLRRRVSVLLRHLALKEHWWLAPVELAAIAWVVVAFARPLLNFSNDLIPHGNEHEATAGLIAIARSSIRDFREFPLWNPFFQTGVPYLGDPTSHFYNPIASVPGIILGPLNGPKLSIVLSFLLAGVGQWYLCSALGISRPIRVWAALVAAMSGPLVIRFSDGHYNIGLAAGFIPLVFAFTIQSLRSRSGLYPCLAGLSFAMLVFSGSPYYRIYTAAGLFVTGLFYIVRVSARRPFLAIDTTAAMQGIRATLWATGFSAAQLLPQIEAYPFVSKWLDPDMGGARNVVATFRNLLIADASFYQPRGLMFGEEYAYVGFLPLMGLALSAPAWLRGVRRRETLLMAVLFLLFLCWASAKYTFFRYIYAEFPWLYRMRFPATALVEAIPFYLALAGLGLDHLLRSAIDTSAPLPGRRFMPTMVGAAAFAAVSLLGVSLVFGVADVYQSNNDFVYQSPRPTDQDRITERLRAMDPSVYSVSIADGSWGVGLAMYEHQLKKLPTPWSWWPNLRAFNGQEPIEARAKYLVLRTVQTPVEEDAVLVSELEGYRIYRLTDSPPYASLVAGGPSSDSQNRLEGAREVAARFVSNRIIEVDAEAREEEDRLVILESYYPGWSVQIDGAKPQKTDNFGGFNSTPAVPGRHTYRFTFNSATASRGLAVTIGTVLGALALGIAGAAASGRGRRLLRLKRGYLRGNGRPRRGRA
jgi:hypothetical protein